MHHMIIFNPGIQMVLAHLTSMLLAAWMLLLVLMLMLMLMLVLMLVVLMLMLVVAGRRTVKTDPVCGRSPTMLKQVGSVVLAWSAAKRGKVDGNENGQHRSSQCN